MDKNSAKLLGAVHPELAQRITQLIALGANIGLDIRVVQGLRMFEQQNKLYNQQRDGKDNDGDGRVDESDEKVTNAKGGESNHNYGLAGDLCVFVNGKPDWNNLENFKIIGKLAKQVGLEWGGDWKFKDRPHVQMRGLSVKECFALYRQGGIPAVWKRIDQLLAGAKPTVFVPGEDDILELGDIGGAVRNLQNALADLGFLQSHEIDGEFGKITKNAVIAFQRQNKLTADGLAGPVTKQLLEKAVAEKRSFSDLDDSEIKLEIPEKLQDSAAASVIPADPGGALEPENAPSPAVVQPKQAEEQLPPPNTTATVEETTVERSENASGTTETKTTVSTEIFNAENISAFIPRIGKLKWLGVIPGAGLISTVYAYLQNAPAELVFVLGFITGVTAFAFLQFIFRHREKVLDFINICYQTTADPNRHNLIPVSSVIDSDKRQNELLGSLVKIVQTNGNVK